MPSTGLEPGTSDPKYEALTILVDEGTDWIIIIISLLLFSCWTQNLPDFPYTGIILVTGLVQLLVSLSANENIFFRFCLYLFSLGVGGVYACGNKKVQKIET